MSRAFTVIVSSYPYQYKIDYCRFEKEFQVVFEHPELPIFPEEETINFKDSSEVINFIKKRLESWFIATLISYESKYSYYDISKKGSIVDFQTFNSINDNGIKEFIEQLKLQQYKNDNDNYYDDDDLSEEDKNADEEDDDEDSKYNEDDIYDNEEFDKTNYSLAVYFTNNIYDKMEPVECCPTSYSNEIELGTGENDYRLYFYVYNRNKNCLLLSEGTGGEESYFEHSQLLEFLEEEFESPFKCIDYENKKIYERKDKVTVERNLFNYKNI